MPEPLQKNAALFRPVDLAGQIDLAVTEYPERQAWSIQTGRDQGLDSFSQALFGQPTAIGTMRGDETLRLIRLWPHQALLLSTNPVLPAAAKEMADMASEVGHGICELGLAGADARAFLSSYVSVDLAAAGISAAGCVRCLLGHYPIMLWWDEIHDIRILTERSLAQSFCDQLQQLALRWSPGTL